MEDEQFYEELLSIRNLLRSGSLDKVERDLELEILNKIEHSELKKLTQYHITYSRLLHGFIDSNIQRLGSSDEVESQR